MIRPHRWLVVSLAVATVALIAATPPPNLPQALAAQQQLALEHPQDGAVLNDLGNLLLLAGRNAEAEEAYRRALTLSPERVSARFNLALLLQQQGHLEAALGEFRQVVEQQPDQAWAHYQIGAILESRGNGAAAIRAYARAFSLDPELSFPDVNPHVIENQMVAEALLLSQRGSGALPHAPNAYEDPARIRSLLLPPASAEAEAQEEATPGDAEPPRAAARREAPRAGSAVPPRTLTEDDLEPGTNLGQAAPPGASPRRSGGVRSPNRNTGFSVPGYVPGRTDDTRTDDQGRTITPDGRMIQRPGGVVVAPPPAPGQRTPGGTRFRPGTSSTGRLEIEVLPRPAPPERAAG